MTSCCVVCVFERLGANSCFRVLLLSPDVEIFSPVQTENLSHLLASMHLAIKQQDSGEEQCGTYGHITNTGFEVFVER